MIHTRSVASTHVPTPEIRKPPVNSVATKRARNAEMIPTRLMADAAYFSFILATSGATID